MLIFTQSLTHAPLRRRRALAVSATWRREKTLRRDAAASAIDVGIRRGPAAAPLSADCDACTAAAAAAWRSSAVCARAARAVIMTRESAETLGLSLPAGTSDGLARAAEIRAVVVVAGVVVVSCCVAASLSILL